MSRMPRLPAVTATLRPSSGGSESVSSSRRTAAGTSVLRGRGNVTRARASLGRALTGTGNGKRVKIVSPVYPVYPVFPVSIGLFLDRADWGDREDWADRVD